jgi:hypothetical protein
MSELIADLFISVDGCATASHGPEDLRGAGRTAGTRSRRGQEPAFARLPDIGLDLVGQSVLDGRIVLSEYRPSGVPPYAS